MNIIRTLQKLIGPKWGKFYFYWPTLNLYFNPILPTLKSIKNHFVHMLKRNHISTCRRKIIRSFRIFGQKWPKIPVKHPKKSFYIPLRNQKKSKISIFLKSNVFQITLVHVDVFSSNLPDFLVKNCLKTRHNTPKIQFI